MGLCVQLVCDIIPYRRYYNALSVLLSPIFSENDGLDFLRKRPKWHQIRDTGTADSDDWFFFIGNLRMGRVARVAFKQKSLTHF